jgi:hypothetical protein
MLASFAHHLRGGFGRLGAIGVPILAEWRLSAVFQAQLSNYR